MTDIGGVREASGGRGGAARRGFARRLPRAVSDLRGAARARQCQGRCSRGQLTSGGARGTRRQPTSCSRASAAAAATRVYCYRDNQRTDAARYTGTEAVLTSQVPEVARGTDPQHSIRTGENLKPTAARPLYFIRCSGDDRSRRLLEYTYRVGGCRLVVEHVVSVHVVADTGAGRYYRYEA